MLHYHGALWEDCRIAAFYPGQKNPDLIFIDIDAKDFCSQRAFKTALTKTLNNIKNKIGGHPTLLWSGRGCHVIQPINCNNVDLDTVEQFSSLVRDKDVNKAFLQFASNYLSGGKRDSCNRTSLKSSLLRIPYSVNSRCKAEGKDPEVKILQEWDGFRPDFRLLLGSFYSHLVAKRIEEEQERAKKYSTMFEGSSNNNNNNNGLVLVTHWIEKLLQTPLDDYRQCARDLIIIPYLVVRRGMTDTNEIEAIVMQWADACNELKSLRPSYREFEREMRSRIHVVLRDRIPSMRFDTLQEENPELAQKLSKTADP